MVFYVLQLEFRIHKKKDYIFSIIEIRKTDDLWKLVSRHRTLLEKNSLE